MIQGKYQHLGKRQIWSEQAMVCQTTGLREELNRDYEVQSPD